MSAKHLQRLRAQQEEEAERKRSSLATPAEDSGEEDESSEEEVEEQPAKLQFNPFSLIQSDSEGDAEDDGCFSGENGGSASDQDEDGDDKPTAAISARGNLSHAAAATAAAETRQAVTQQSSQGSQPEPAKQLETGTQRAGGFREKKRAQKAARAAEAAKDDEAELDAALASQAADNSQIQSSASRQGGQGAAAEGAPVLAVNTKRLKVDDEMKRIFGAGVLAEETREGVRGRARGGMRGRGRVPLKRGILVTPKPHWPPFSGGLSMEVHPGPDGDPEYSYVYSGNYEAVQEIYLDAQRSNDVNQIAALLQQTPYHTDSLLTLFDLQRSMGEHAQADEMLQMALYAYEQAWHHSFSPATAQVSMDSSLDTNKTFFLALFYHIQGLSRRGLHRTALEVAKLLLAMDQRDPLGMNLYMDFLAVCAGDYEFMRRMVMERPELSMLPNWSFAMPMAAANTLPKNADGSFSVEGFVKGPYGAGEHEMGYDVEDGLRMAVASFPLVVTRLLAKLNDQSVGKGLDWQAVLGEPLFREAPDHGSESYSHLVDLYVERSHPLWKPAPMLAWLRSACKDVLKDAGCSGTPQQDWTQTTASAFPSMEANQYRRLRVQDFSDTIATIPREEVEAAMRAQAANAEDQEVQAALDAVQALQARHEQGHGQPAPGQVAEGGGGVVAALEALIRSLNPNFDPATVGDAPAGDDAREGTDQQQQQQDQGHQEHAPHYH
mmetsp:Transcript_7991/g.23577  ORF Transcript_7991/g.23577 Transcript_7991/m.23577 type:complete len:721 (-) Transcript_7991:247-2409(-)|eukprot:CAMPEP_0206143652 /NCGR_PEP_ID=MMETSP1473-20131121/21332_1 /ASSEMBLY_ACC=CAM_ASM_001109 /TAXON_ID=1461547 /ORGANISM="Stichococcus sp, Strain RCC1054" /LENGTH=720 /DNA_ID=CAMNT_0053539157 /DNA_START=109 /DNA_END=2271 /DNA_ORIENTATION=+